MEDKDASVRYFSCIVFRDTGSIQVSSSNIFDELNAVLAGGNGTALQDNQQLALCSERAALVAPALQSADWSDVMRRIEALNQLFAVQRDADTKNGISL